MIDRYTMTAYTGTTRHAVERLQLTLSDTWAPYVRGTLVIKLPAADVLAALDPRQAVPPRIDVHLVRAFGDDRNSIAAWTAAAAPPTVKLSELTALGFNKASWGTGKANHYNGAPIPGQELRLTLTVDELDTDEAAGTCTLTIGGAELRLQEQTALDTRPLLGNRIRDAVNEVLKKTGLGQLGAGEGEAYYLPPVWEERQTAWDVLHDWLDLIEYRLICDEHGKWRIVNRTATRPGKAVTLAGLKEMSRQLTRREWYDAVEIWWKWTEPDPITGQPVQRTQLEQSTNSTSWTKVKNVELTGPPKGSNTANWLLQRYRRMGERHTYTAPLDLDVKPLDHIQITDSAGTRTATITSVTISLPEAEIVIETRED